MGGAPLNFAAHAGRLGHSCILISAVGTDDRGSRALCQLGELGLRTDFVHTTTNAETGVVSVEFLDGQPEYEIHRPAAYDHIHLTPSDYNALTALKPSWIYFGTLNQTADAVRSATARLLAMNPTAERFYDLNLRTNSYSRELVRELMAVAHHVKLNEMEAAIIMQMFGSQERSIEEFCYAYRKLYGWRTVCVTRGQRGCAILAGDQYHEADGYPVRVMDTVGAGDAFAAALVHGLSQGWPVTAIADFGNRLGAFVASRKGAIPAYNLAEIAVNPASASLAGALLRTPILP